MNELPSAEFRKRYAKLTEAVVVTVNGHPIGRWFPMDAPSSEHGPRFSEPGLFPASNLSPQAQRDDLLRKINRGK